MKGPRKRFDLRARRQSENALAVGRFVETRVPRILHPGLASHPQHNLAKSQMEDCGPIFSFILDGGAAKAMKFLNALELVDISNNIGDSRSLCCHPWTTTHYGVRPRRASTWGSKRGCCASTSGWKIRATSSPIWTRH